MCSRNGWWTAPTSGFWHLLNCMSQAKRLRHIYHLLQPTMTTQMLMSQTTSVPCASCRQATILLLLLARALCQKHRCIHVLTLVGATCGCLRGTCLPRGLYASCCTYDCYSPGTCNHFRLRPVWHSCVSLSMQLRCFHDSA